MALFNEILVGRYNRALQKLFGLKGEPPAPQLASEVSITHTFFSGVENRYLESWDRFAAAINVAAVALNQSGVRVRNPLTSNVMIVVEKITYGETANDQPTVTFGTDPGDLATVIAASNSALDRRTRPNPSLVLSRQATTPVVPALASASTLENHFIGANVPRDVITFEEQEIPLIPGAALQIQALAVNQALTTSIIWRERYLEEGERT